MHGLTAYWVLTATIVAPFLIGCTCCGGAGSVYDTQENTEKYLLCVVVRFRDNRLVYLVWDDSPIINKNFCLILFNRCHPPQSYEWGGPINDFITQVKWHYLRRTFLLQTFNFFILFHSCCSHVRVFRKTLVHALHISYTAILNAIYWIYTMCIFEAKK